MGRIILDLCGGTGAWSEPYRAAGYDVRLVTLPEIDVRQYDPPASDVYGVLAAPPGTEFASSGARWWAGKDPGKLAEALEIVAACLRIIDHTRPWFWALENPVGRLSRHIGPPRYSWHPWEVGDPWWKRTCMWGNHNEPRRLAGAAEPPPFHDQRWRRSQLNALSKREIGRLVVEGLLPPDWIHKLGPSPARATLRSITPPGFARAFYEANS
jgi:hypothetical protein